MGAVVAPHAIDRDGDQCGLTRLGLDDLLAAVEAGRADVMAQVRLAAGRLDRERGRAQVIVRAVHAALGRRLLVLLNCHLTTPL